MYKMPLWVEGQRLHQQHFQYWQAYQEQQWCYRLKAMQPFYWGLIALRIHQEALAWGEVRIEHCQVIFPDGSLHSFTEDEKHTLSYQVVEQRSSSIHLYLSWPDKQGVTGVTGYPDNQASASWQAAYQIINDLYDGSRQAELLLAKPKLQLTDVLDKQARFQQLKIVEISKMENGGVVLSSHYLPTVLSTGSSNNLTKMIKNFDQLLAEKLDRVPKGQEKLMGTIIRRALISLRNVGRHGSAHPYQLYLVIAALVGELQTYQQGSSMEDIPLYQHDDLAGTFAPLLGQAKTLLTFLLRQASHIINLKKVNDYIYLAEVFVSENQNPGLLIKVSSNTSDAKQTASLEQQIKVASFSELPMRIAKSLPGLPLSHCESPSMALEQSNAAFFKCQARGEAWADILRTQTLAVFVPARFSIDSVQLLVMADEA